MRVEERTETRTIKINTYVAEDGKEFNTQRECLDYEEELKKSDIEKKLDDIRIPELDDVTPLHSDPDCFTAYHEFRWFRVESKEEADKIEQLYRDAGYYIGSFDCDIYPNLLGVEDCDNTVWTYTFTEMQNLVSTFFNVKFGIEIEYKRREDSIVTI